MITTILSNINNKFMKLIEQLPKGVCTNYKYAKLQEVTKEELLTFVVSHVQDVCLDKIF